MKTQFHTNKQPVDKQKLRGGYYTPVELSNYLTDWAVRIGNERILEPSCGDGNFVDSILHRLTVLKKNGYKISSKITAVEIETNELEKAKARLNSYSLPKLDTEFILGDFFDLFEKLNREEKYDVALGNPPYIRFQYFDGESREKAFSHLRNAGYNPTKLANAWSAFVQLSIELLKEGGRLAMVLPAELLQVGYAGELRKRLSAQFSHIVIIGFKKLVFPEIQQEVVLVLAEGKREVSLLESDIHTIEFEDRKDLLSSEDLEDAVKHIPSKHSRPLMKWTGLFLNEKSFYALDNAQRSKLVIPLGKIANVDVGVVTGRNKFFVFDEKTQKAILANNYTVPIIGRTSTLKSIVFDENDFEKYQLTEPGYLLNLNNIPEKDFPKKLKEYIAHGESEDVHKGYKCRVRKRWFDVPSIYVPDAFMFRQIHKYPLFVVNRAGATSTDTIHRVRLINGTKPEKLAAICFNSLTLAWAEVSGRSYGGGVLELETSEAEHMPIPYDSKIEIDSQKVDTLLRSGKDLDALDYVDSVVLNGYMGMSNSTIKHIRNAWIELRNRRTNRRAPNLVEEKKAMITYEQSQPQQLRLLEKAKKLKIKSTKRK
jgi:adenine-specific DNA-methyltransferase